MMIQLGRKRVHRREMAKALLDQNFIPTRLVGKKRGRQTLNDKDEIEIVPKRAVVDMIP